jgi:hypothetical protein
MNVSSPKRKYNVKFQLSRGVIPNSWWSPKTNYQLSIFKKGCRTTRDKLSKYLENWSRENIDKPNETITVAVRGGIEEVCPTKPWEDVQLQDLIDLFKKSALWRSLRIKENPAQPFGLPDWPNDRIYPQTTSQGRLLKRSIKDTSPSETR